MARVEGSVWYRRVSGLPEILRVGSLNTSESPVGHTLRDVETGEQIAVLHGPGSWRRCEVLGQQSSRQRAFETLAWVARHEAALPGRYNYRTDVRVPRWQPERACGRPEQEVLGGPTEDCDRRQRLGGPFFIAGCYCGIARCWRGDHTKTVGQYYVGNATGASGYGTMNGSTVPLECRMPTKPGSR